MASCRSPCQWGQSGQGEVQSFHTNTQTITPSKSFTPPTHHTRFILMLATCDVYRAHRHGSESPHPGSTPGLNPCNHLARQACGPWRTHRHNTYIVTYKHVACGDMGVVASSVESNAVWGHGTKCPSCRSPGPTRGWPKGWVTVAQAVQRVMLPTPCVGGRSRRSRARATGK